MNQFRGRSRVLDLEEEDAMRLLASTGFGRVVFTKDALPAIRPVNHVVEHGMVIIRTRLNAQVTGVVRPGTRTDVVVAYEADDIDPVTRTGWSVVVTGLARVVTDPAVVARYERLLDPWVNTVMDTVLAIEPSLVTGIRLVTVDTETPRTQ